jgi:hypothetical protein
MRNTQTKKNPRNMNDPARLTQVVTHAGMGLDPRRPWIWPDPCRQWV